jgi:hypothetical protein
MTSHRKKVPPPKTGDPEHDGIIERYKRLIQRAEQTTPPPFEEEMISPLRLTRNVLHVLKQQAIKELYRHSNPSPNEERAIKSGIAARETLVLLHAQTFAKAIEWAVGEYADMVTQNVTARASRRDISKTLRAAIWEESLRFGEALASEHFWSEWLVNGRFPIVPFREGGWTEEEKQRFFQRVRRSRDEWIWEADRRIDVRLILCGNRVRARRVERRRREIAKLMIENPDFYDHDLCLEMDKRNEASLSTKNDTPFPVPDFLKRIELRLWADAFGAGTPQETQKMHEYLSKIRKEFRIRKPADLPRI